MRRGRRPVAGRCAGPDARPPDRRDPRARRRRAARSRCTCCTGSSRHAPRDNRARDHGRRPRARGCARSPRTSPSRCSASPAGRSSSASCCTWSASGSSAISISVSYLAEVIEEHFGDGTAFGGTIDYLREDEPLGTAGALGLLPEPPTAPLLVVNGDLVTSVDVDAMLRTSTPHGGFAATIGTRRYLHTVPFGCIVRDGDRVVCDRGEADAVARGQRRDLRARARGSSGWSRAGERVDDARRPRRGPRRAARPSGRSRSRTTGSTSASATSCAGPGGRLSVSLRDVPVLVTGADGFIGSHLVERLVREGARVRAFCLYNSRGSARLAGRGAGATSGRGSRSGSATSATRASWRRAPRGSRSCSTSPR